MSYILSCCSSVDLPAELLQSRDIRWTGFHVTLGDREYRDDLGATIPYPEFYKSMADGADTKTAQINVDEYMQYFSSLLAEGTDLLHVVLSSGLSGSYNSAMIAADELREQFPDRKIYVLDSRMATAGEGLLLEKLADLRDSGLSVEELYAWGETHKLEIQGWFFTTDLTWFIKGGRVSKLSGWFGTMLNICPLLNINGEGKLIPRLKLRGKAAVINALVDRMEQHAAGGTAYDGPCRLVHAHAPEDAAAVIAQIEDRFPALKGKVQTTYVGTTIGAHTGPGAVGLFFWGDPRTEE